MNLETAASYTPTIITVLAVFTILAEWVYLTLTKGVDSHKEGIVSFISAGLSFFPIFVLTRLVLIGFMFWLYQFRIFDPGLKWYVWILAWVFYDFMWWLVHWLGHNVRLLWCLHSVHHTPKEMKLSVAFRGSFMDFAYVGHTIIWAPLLGFHPFMILIVEALGRLYGILVHVSEKWAPNKRRNVLEQVFISPSLHRVHHSVNPLYLDQNYGEVLTVWDKLFKTYQPEVPEEKPVFGTVKEIDSENLWDTQTSEFRALWKDIRSTPSILNKLRYLVKPPGWNHRDGGLMALDIRKKALDQNYGRTA